MRKLQTNQGRLSLTLWQAAIITFSEKFTAKIDHKVYYQFVSKYILESYIQLNLCNCKSLFEVHHLLSC